MVSMQPYSLYSSFFPKNETVINDRNKSLLGRIFVSRIFGFAFCHTLNLFFFQLAHAPLNDFS